MSSAHVSLAPTSASGLLCNSSPLATAIAVATTEADVHALANVVGQRHTPQAGATWAAEMYGPPQPPAVAVAALHPQRSPSTSSLTAPPNNGSGTLTDDGPFATPPSSAALGQASQQQQQQQHQQQHPRVSVVSAHSLAEADDAGASSTHLLADAFPGQPFAAVTTTTSGPSRLRKNVSWQCGLCGYHVLAMDQDGTPLPFATSAFGNTLPLLCPRCKLSHTSWQSSTPFNEQGDHLNLPTTYSNRYVAPSGTSAAAAAATRDGAVGAGAATTATRADHAASHNGSLLRQRAAAATVSLVAQQRAAQLRSAGGAAVAAARQRRAYYCGRCNRRLLRVDANGELVDMDREADGSIRPIRCPGCGESHGDWVVRPYAVHR